MVLAGTRWEDSMRTTGKKKRVGRPRATQRRPVLAARVPKEFHARILASAAISGRNASEELIWRAQQSYEWEAARGTIQAWLAEARRAHEGSLEAALRNRGYLSVAMLPQGTAWISPDADKEKMNLAIDATKLAQDMLPGLVTALREALGNLAKTE